MYSEMEGEGERAEKLNSLGGFLVQARDPEWMRVIGLLEFWGQAPFPKKEKWRDLVRSKASDWEKRQWTKWRQGRRLQEGWLATLKEAWGKESYIDNVGRSDRKLLAGVRLLVGRKGGELRRG
jgi:hypothetical protein